MRSEIRDKRMFSAESEPVACASGCGLPIAPHIDEMFPMPVCFPHPFDQPTCMFFHDHLDTYASSM